MHPKSSFSACISGITYKRDALITASQAADLFVRSGINRPANDLPRIEKMLSGANLTWTAWDDETLVGIARTLTDFAWCAYLSDLAVDTAYQKAGVGRLLVEKTRETLGPDVALVLLAAPGAMEYYPKIGFEPAPNAFLIRRVK